MTQRRTMSWCVIFHANSFAAWSEHGKVAANISSRPVSKPSQIFTSFTLHFSKFFWQKGTHSYMLSLTWRFSFSEAVYHAFKRYPLDGKTGFVIGSETPWVEVFALLNGAKEVRSNNIIHENARWFFVVAETECAKSSRRSGYVTS